MWLRSVACHALAAVLCNGAMDEERAAWLRCARGGEINWPGLRSKLATYADKYIDAPQLFAEEARLAFVYAHKPLLGVAASGPCPLGDLTLRLFMWLFLESHGILEAVESAPFAQDELQPAAMLAEVLRAFWAIPLSWAEVLATGWPVFSVLSQLGLKALGSLQASSKVPRDASNNCEDISIWGGDRRYLSAVEHSFQSGARLPVHASLSVMLSVEREKCPLAFACAALALADSVRWEAAADENPGPVARNIRNAFYYRYAAIAPLAVDSAMSEDLHTHVGTAYANDEEALLDLAEGVVRGHIGGPSGGVRSPQKKTPTHPVGQLWPTNVLLTPWPLWRLVDRLGCSEWVEALTRPLAPTPETRRLHSASPTFSIHVFPHRVSSDGLQSSRTRASRQPYCAKEFQNEFDAMRLRYDRTETPSLLQVVEAGPHLGDCLLWAAARVGCRGLRAIGYDVIHQLVTLVQKSIVQNRMARCLEVRLAFLAEVSAPMSPYRGVGSLALDDEVVAFVHVLKVHTNGGEDAILRGARQLFTDPARGVGSVVLNSASTEVLQGAVDFLTSLQSVGVPPYTVEIRGEPVLAGSGARVAQALREMIAASGSVQLIARRSDLPPFPPSNITARQSQTPQAG